MKFKVKSTHYMKDEHNPWSRERTEYDFRDAEWCCPDMETTYRDRILAIESVDDEPKLRTLEYRDTEYEDRDYYAMDFKFCPFCGYRIEWDIVERSKVEYECREEVIPETKKVYCTPKETKLDSS